MADIKQYTDEIAKAIYGEEVRSSIINALNKVNDDNNSYQGIKDDILASQNEIDEQVANFDGKVAEASSVMGDLNTTIEDARNIRGKVDSSITNANTVKGTLDSTTATALTTKADLQAATTSANTATTNANTAKTNLQKVIDSATVMNTALSNVLAQANTAKNGLDTTNATAATAKKNLDASISNASTAKSQLEQVITTTGTIKEDVSAVTTIANDAIKNLNEKINAANDAKALLDTSSAEAITNLANLQSENFKSAELLEAVNLVAIKSTASGTNINVNDSANAPIKSMVVTPTDESMTSVDITVCGKNLLDFSKAKFGNHNGITVASSGDGGYTYKGTVINNVYVSVWFLGSFKTNNVLFTLPAGTYTVCNADIYDKTGKSLCNYTYPNTPKTFTLSEPVDVTGVRTPNGVLGQTYDLTLYPYVVRGSNAEYEQYKGQTATIDTTTQTGWENLKMYYPITNIIPSVDANIDCTYIADTKNYIDNKLNI